MVLKHSSESHGGLIKTRTVEHNSQSLRIFISKKSPVMGMPMLWLWKPHFENHCPKQGLPRWVKNLLAMQEIQIQSLDRKDPLEKGTATHPWRIPWTEEPWGLQSMGSQRVGHDCNNQVSMHALNKRNTILSKRDEYTQIITRQNVACLWDAKCVVGSKEKHCWAAKGFGEDKWTRTWRIGITDKETGMNKG